MERKHAMYSRITVNPEVCTGKPCIRGVGFPVTTLLGYFAGGMSQQEVLETFSFLEQEDIQQAFAFAAQALDESPKRVNFCKGEFLIYT